MFYLLTYAVSLLDCIKCTFIILLDVFEFNNWYQSYLTGTMKPKRGSISLKLNLHRYISPYREHFRLIKILRREFWKKTICVSNFVYFLAKHLLRSYKIYIILTAFVGTSVLTFNTILQHPSWFFLKKDHRTQEVSHFNITDKSA